MHHYGELNYCAPYSGALNYCAPYSCSPNYFVPYSCASNYCCNLVKLHTPNYCALCTIMVNSTLVHQTIVHHTPVHQTTGEVQNTPAGPKMQRGSITSSLCSKSGLVAPRIVQIFRPPSPYLPFFTTFNFLIFP